MYGSGLQMRFLGHFLKGEATSCDKQPKELLQVRHPGEQFVERHESEWPLARTQWTRLYLDATDASLSIKPPRSTASVTYPGFGDGVTLVTAPLEQATEITGP